MQTNKAVLANRSLGEWLVSLPTILILLTVILLGTGEYIHSQLLKFGESQWDQYFILRADIANPDCEANPDIDAEVNRLVSEAENSAADELDMFAEEVDPVAIRQSVERSAEMCREKWAIAKANQERVTDDVRVYRFIETGVAKLITFVGQYKQLLLCVLILICAITTTLTRHHIGLRSVTTRKDYYTAVTMQFFAHVMLMVSEISYRAAEQQSMAEGVQVQFFYMHAIWIAGFGALALVSIYQLFNPPKDLESGGHMGHAFLSVPLYAYMSVSASLQFWVAPAISTAITGEASQPYYQGIGVYLSQMMELSGMFLALALYIWIGMLLKQTRVTELFFNVIRPWKLSPELMCFVVLVLAAWPTAFTGASGIFIIAAGTIIYAELMRNGARRGLALASTAMSGSMGVVLAPYLLVVIIAALNKDVTTGEMYHFGFMIYLLTAFLFLIISQLSRTEPARIAPAAVAIPEMLKNFGPLIPYIVIIMATVGVYSTVFNQGVDEFSAPYILPVILLATLAYDKLGSWVSNLSSGLVIVGSALGLYTLFGGDAGGFEIAKGLIKYGIAVWLAVLAFRHAKTWDRDRAAAQSPSLERRRPMEIAMREGTNETVGHIGALLMLMALSVSIGGTIERSHVMDLFPQMDSVWGTMTVLVITMVVIGMIMDPYGAVILVNATIAQVAFQAGIDPLHFWMFALLSFELGYLTPPVALNHLLTRHLVGDREVQLAKEEAAASGRGWWYRHERYALPVTIMFIALMIVAYGPLLYPDFKDSLPNWVQAMFVYVKS
ncbi:MAG: TRAP transporter large permease subunit [Gammaproteobacteria bacterium]